MSNRPETKATTVATQPLVLRFRSLAKAKRAWEILWLLSSALKLFPADFWVHYDSNVRAYRPIFYYCSC